MPPRPESTVAIESDGAYPGDNADLADVPFPVFVADLRRRRSVHAGGGDAPVRAAAVAEVHVRDARRRPRNGGREHTDACRPGVPRRHHGVLLDRDLGEQPDESFPESITIDDVTNVDSMEADRPTSAEPATPATRGRRARARRTIASQKPMKPSPSLRRNELADAGGKRRAAAERLDVPRLRQRCSRATARWWAARIDRASTNTPWLASSARSASPIASTARGGRDSASLTAPSYSSTSDELAAAERRALVVHGRDATGVGPDGARSAGGCARRRRRRRAGLCSSRCSGMPSGTGQSPSTTLPSRSMRITSCGRELVPRQVPRVAEEACRRPAGT